jgi:phosphodiesterase/alkaline phosphatase D-like protein
MSRWGNRILLRASWTSKRVLGALVLAAMSAVFVSASSPASAAGAPVPLIVDTDIYSSVDDVGALATAFGLQVKNEAKVIAITVNYSTDRSGISPNSWKCAAAIAQFYNSGNVPIGVDGPANATGVNSPDFVGPCAAKASPSTPAPDSALNVYRRALASQPDGSVVIASTGFLENLSALLHSPADSISPLTGAQLVAQKVKELDIMGGGYPSRVKEHNLAGNPAAAQDIAANWPSKIVWSGYEVGDNVHTGQSIPSVHPASSPVRIAYGAFISPGSWYYSYDLTAVFHAIRGSDPSMTEVGPGTNSVDSNGGNIFSPGAGHQYYLQLNSEANAESAIESLLDTLPGPADVTPPAISGASATAITTTGATVNWTTDESSDTQVEYGTTTSYGSSTTLNTGLTTSHSQALTGLTAGTLYHYRVKSRDAAGNLAVSGDLSFTTTALAAPTLTATPASVTAGAQVSVAWSGVVSPTINDWIGLYPQGAADTAFAKWVFTATCTNSTGTPKASGSCTFTMPTTTGVYEFRLFAANGYTKLATSGQVTVGPAADTTPPAISAVGTDTPTTTGATIGWTTDESSDSQVEYGTSTAYGSSTTLDTSLVTSHSVALSGLAPSTVYHYRVKSKDSAGNQAVSSDFTFTTATGADTTPPTISGVAASAITTSGVTISWSTSEPGDTQIEYGADTAYGTSTALDSTYVSSHSQTLSGLTPSTLYHYRVDSRDAAGNLATSGDFTFTTAGIPGATTPPSGLVATPSAGTGQVTVTWNAPVGLNAATTTYALQHMDANDTSYSTVASGIAVRTYTFPSATPEAEGTWTYRVIATDGTLTTDASAPSNPAVVDRTGPNPASFQPNRAPEYTGDGNWWKGSVTMTVVPNGDALLPDGSPGSGINTSATTAPFTVTRSGPTVVDGWVQDKAGNWAKASMTVQVDATPPGVWWNTKCGQTYKRNQVVSGNWGASDANVGLAGPTSGNVPFSTSTSGSKTLTVTVADKVGNTASATCAYKVS